MSDALLVIIDSDDEDDDSLPSQSQHNPNQTPRRPPLTPRKLKAEPGSERRQLSITRFFSSPTSKSSPAYQPTIRSFFDGRSVAPQVVLPNDDGEPLAPVPDPFFYRSPSPTAYANANISKAVLAPAPSPFFYRSPSPTAYPNADMSKAVLAMSSSSTTNGFARNAGIQSVFENGFPSPLDNKVNRASPATSSRPTTNGDDSKKSQRRSFYEQDAAFIGFGGRGVPEKDLDATPSMLAEAPRVNGTPSLKLGAGPADLMQTHSEKSIPTPTTKPGLIQSNTTGAPSASLNPFQHPIRQGTGTWRLFGEHHKMSDMATTQHREGPNRLWAAVPTVRRKIPNTQTPPSQSLKTTIGHPAKAPPKATPSSRPPSAPTPSAFALGFRAIPAKGPLTADSISNPTLPARNTAAASHATDRHTTTTTATYSPNTIPLAMVSPTPTATTTPPSASAVTIPSFLFKSSCEVCNRTFAVKTSTIRNPHGDGYLCSVCAAIAAPESTIRGMKPVNASVQRFADANPDAQTMEMEIDMPDIGFDDVQPATDSQSETTDQAIFSSDQALVANIQAFGMSGSNQSQCDRVSDYSSAARIQC